MAKRNVNVIHRLRSDTLTNWNSANPVLEDGETVIVVDGNEKRLKVGDGTTAFKALEYATPALDSIPTVATCATAAATQAKVATSIGGGTFSLTAGKIVYVKFTNAQTYSGQPTLDVDGTGAKGVCKNGTSVGVRYQWSAGEVVGFLYDGTNFVELNGALATTTYYGVTKLSSSVTSTSASLAATPAAVKSAYDLAASKASKGNLLTVTLTASGWTDSQQTVTDEALVASGYGYLVTPDPGSYSSYAAAGVRAQNVTTDGSITFVCSKSPTVDLTVSILKTEVS
jgi:hypothetical protein